MVQLSKRRPSTPKQAATACRPIDQRLDAALFKALGDPTRVKLLGCLAKCGRACSVSEVAECCSVDLSVVSRHLKLLERAGVVTASKHGRQVMYTVGYARLCRSLRELADAVAQCCPADGRSECAGGCCGSR